LDLNSYFQYSFQQERFQKVATTFSLVFSVTAFILTFARGPLLAGFVMIGLGLGIYAVFKANIKQFMAKLFLFSFFIFAATGLTYLIQERRQLIEKSSKNKLGFIEKKERKVRTKSIKEKSTNQLNECVEFKVRRNQNIIEVINNINDLPVGPCNIEIFSKDRTDIRRYINSKIRKIRTANRNVADYFMASDGNISKYLIVEREMNDANSIIEEITVRVCPLI
jgi:hypothetical protein